MIRKRELLRKIEVLEAKQEAMDAALLEIMETVQDLADKTGGLAGRTAELARIIEEDFLPDDSEYRKMKENSDALIAGFNNLLTYQGGGKAGGGEKP